jgi:cellulose synthase/poly-beta-1,6-N-acetylglucosamine synthase-like glycosyltransferase
MSPDDLTLTEAANSVDGARRLARLLTEPVCRSFGLLPVGFHNQVVTVAVTDADDRLAAEIARNLLGHDVELLGWNQDQLDRAFEAVFADQAINEVFEPSRPTAPFTPPPTVANGRPHLRTVRERDEPDGADRLSPGTNGTNGASGTSGANGTSGTNRASGANGTSGTGPSAAPRPARAPAFSGRKRIGEALIGLELITRGQLESALLEQERTGSQVGEILVASGALTELELLAGLGEQLRLQHVDLSGYEPDQAVVRLVPEPVVRTLRCVPLAVDSTTLYVVVADALTDDRIATLSEYTNLEVKEMLATRNAIDDLIARVYEDEYLEIARHGLSSAAPENSAARVLSTGQRVLLILAGLIIVVACVLSVRTTVVVLVSLASAFYLTSLLYQARLIYRSLGSGAYIDVSDEEIDGLDERDLPVYTILVPLYREAAIVPRLLAGLNGLDYPRTKLDVRLLCESDDQGTIEAIQALNPPPHFKLIIVPESQPRTKPKACNYGIIQAAGQYLVIYDAEDKPDPRQLKHAVLAFGKGPGSLTCLQAKLNAFNTHQNLLTRWFSIEYSMHFDLLLPGLCAVSAPVPLGGTSNHFRMDRLRELGAWDPYNVTEDADLGIRLHKAGYSTSMIDSTTLEEANSSVSNWLRQRSRWTKGYLQTWLVHMRNPIRLLAQLGPRGFISFNLVVGGAFIALLNPIFWLLTTLFLFSHAGFIHSIFPAYVFFVASAMLFLGNFVFVYFNVAGSLAAGNYDLTRYALLSPFYWGLMSWAACKGFLQLLSDPFYWEKTDHGLDLGHAAAGSTAQPPAGGVSE